MQVKFKKASATLLAFLFVFGLLPAGLIPARAVEANATVKSRSELTAAISSAPADNTAYIIEITESFPLDAAVSIGGTKTDEKNKNIIIRSAGDAQYTLTQQSYDIAKTDSTVNITTRRHFVVNVSSSLTLENVILQGLSKRDIDETTSDGTPQRVTVGSGGISVLPDPLNPCKLTLNNVVIKECYNNNIGTDEAVTINGAPGGGVFARENSTVNMTNSKIIGCEVTGGGGGAYLAGTVTIDNSIISNNKAARGGGIFLGNGSKYTEVTVTDSEISGNEATNGGGVYVFGKYQKAYQFAWVNYPPGLVLNLKEGSCIAGNTAKASGGGIYDDDTYSAMGGSGATPPPDGIREFNQAGTKINLDGGSIVNNTAGVNGGGVYMNSRVRSAFSVVKKLIAQGSYFNMTSGVISGNTAEGDGGGLYAVDGSHTFNSSSTLISSINVNITGGALIRNSAPNGNGGAIYLAETSVANDEYTQYGKLTVGKDAGFEENTAKNAYGPGTAPAGVDVTVKGSFSLANPINNYDISFVSGTAKNPAKPTATATITTSPLLAGKEFVLAKNVGQAIAYLTDSGYWTADPQHAKRYTPVSNSLSCVDLYSGTYSLALLDEGEVVSMADFEVGASNLNLKLYVVTFEADFDEDTAVNVSPQIVFEGKKIKEAPNPELTGFYVDAWYRMPDLTNKWNFETDTVTADTILYAEWKEAAVATITASANTGGTISPVGEVQVNVGSSRDFTITANSGYVIESVKVNGETITKYPNKNSGSFTCSVTPIIQGTHTIEAVFAPHGNLGNFIDTSNYEWYAGCIDFVTEAGLFRGTRENTFEPELKMSRAMLVTALYRLAEQLDCDMTGAEINFPDVNMQEYYIAPLKWAVKNGLVNGYPSGEFRPGDDISREELAVIFIRFTTYLQLNLETDVEYVITDASFVGDWAEASVTAVLKAGLMQGNANGRFGPQDPLTRAQAAQLFMNLITLYGDQMA